MSNKNQRAEARRQILHRSGQQDRQIKQAVEAEIRHRLGEMREKGEIRSPYPGYHERAHAALESMLCVMDTGAGAVSDACVTSGRAVSITIRKLWEMIPERGSAVEVAEELAL